MAKLRIPSTQQTTLDEIPIGFYMPWEKGMSAALPPWYVECNGQLLADAESPLNNEYIPNLNGVSKTKSVTFTNASATATMATTRDIYAGALVVSASVPAVTKVLSIDNDTTITLDQNATATGAVSSTIGGNGPVFLAGGPVSGLWRPDREQGHRHVVENLINQGTTQRLSPNAGTSNTNNIADGNQYAMATTIVSDGTNGPPRTGDETYPKHHTVCYVMKVKTTGQTKLITGYSLMGEEFGGIAEAGTGIKATDRLVVFDPAGGIYKNVYVGRSLTRGIGEYSTDITLTVGSPRLVHVTTAATDRTITLPAGSTLFPGDEFEVYKVDSGTGKVTVARASTDTIDGVTAIDIDSQYDMARLRWTGAYWTLTEYKDHGTWTGGTWERHANGGVDLYAVKNTAALETFTFPFTLIATPVVGMSLQTPVVRPNAAVITALSTTALSIQDDGSASEVANHVHVRGRWRA